MRKLRTREHKYCPRPQSETGEEKGLEPRKSHSRIQPLATMLSCLPEGQGAVLSTYCSLCLALSRCLLTFADSNPAIPLLGPHWPSFITEKQAPSLRASHMQFLLIEMFSTPSFPLYAGWLPLITLVSAEMPHPSLINTFIRACIFLSSHLLQ